MVNTEKQENGNPNKKQVAATSEAFLTSSVAASTATTSGTGARKPFCNSQPHSRTVSAAPSRAGSPQFGPIAVAPLIQQTTPTFSPQTRPGHDDSAPTRTLSGLTTASTSSSSCSSDSTTAHHPKDPPPSRCATVLAGALPTNGNLAVETYSSPSTNNSTSHTQEWQPNKRAPFSPKKYGHDSKDNIRRAGRRVPVPSSGGATTGSGTATSAAACPSNIKKPTIIVNSDGATSCSILQHLQFCSSSDEEEEDEVEREADPESDPVEAQQPPPAPSQIERETRTTANVDSASRRVAPAKARTGTLPSDSFLEELPHYWYEIGEGGRTIWRPAPLHANGAPILEFGQHATRPSLLREIIPDFELVSTSNTDAGAGAKMLNIVHQQAEQVELHEQPPPQLTDPVVNVLDENDDDREMINNNDGPLPRPPSSPSGSPAAAEPAPPSFAAVAAKNRAAYGPKRGRTKKKPKQNMMGPQQKDTLRANLAEKQCEGFLKSIKAKKEAGESIDGFKLADEVRRICESARLRQETERQLIKRILPMAKTVCAPSPALFELETRARPTSRRESGDWTSAIVGGAATTSLMSSSNTGNLIMVPQCALTTLQPSSGRTSGSLSRTGSSGTTTLQQQSLLASRAGAPVPATGRRTASTSLCPTLAHENNAQQLAQLHASLDQHQHDEKGPMDPFKLQTALQKLVEQDEIYWRSWGRDLDEHDRKHETVPGHERPGTERTTSWPRNNWMSDEQEDEKGTGNRGLEATEEQTTAAPAAQGEGPEEVLQCSEVAGKADDEEDDQEQNLPQTRKDNDDGTRALCREVPELQRVDALQSATTIAEARAARAGSDIEAEVEIIGNLAQPVVCDLVREGAQLDEAEEGVKEGSLQPKQDYARTPSRQEAGPKLPGKTKSVMGGLLAERLVLSSLQPGNEQADRALEAQKREHDEMTANNEEITLFFETEESLASKTSSVRSNASAIVEEQPEASPIVTGSLAVVDYTDSSAVSNAAADVRQSEAGKKKKSATSTPTVREQDAAVLDAPKRTTALSRGKAKVKNQSEAPETGAISKSAQDRQLSPDATVLAVAQQQLEKMDQSLRLFDDLPTKRGREPASSHVGHEADGSLLSMGRQAGSRSPTPTGVAGTTTSTTSAASNTANGQVQESTASSPTSTTMSHVPGAAPTASTTAASQQPPAATSSPDDGQIASEQLEKFPEAEPEEDEESEVDSETDMSDCSEDDSYPMHRLRLPDWMERAAWTLDLRVPSLPGTQPGSPNPDAKTSPQVWGLQPNLFQELNASPALTFSSSCSTSPRHSGFAQEPAGAAGSLTGPPGPHSGNAKSPLAPPRGFRVSSFTSDITAYSSDDEEFPSLASAKDKDVKTQHHSRTNAAGGTTTTSGAPASTGTSATSSRGSNNSSAGPASSGPKEKMRISLTSPNANAAAANTFLQLLPQAGRTSSASTAANRHRASSSSTAGTATPILGPSAHQQGAMSKQCSPRPSVGPAGLPSSATSSRKNSATVDVVLNMGLGLGEIGRGILKNPHHVGTGAAPCSASLDPATTAVQLGGTGKNFSGVLACASAPPAASSSSRSAPVHPVQRQAAPSTGCGKNGSTGATSTRGASAYSSSTDALPACGNHTNDNGPHTTPANKLLWGNKAQSGTAGVTTAAGTNSATRSTSNSSSTQLSAACSTPPPPLSQPTTLNTSSRGRAGASATSLNATGAPALNASATTLSSTSSNPSSGNTSPRSVTRASSRASSVDSTASISEGGTTGARPSGSRGKLLPWGRLHLRKERTQSDCSTAETDDSLIAAGPDDSNSSSKTIPSSNADEQTTNANQLRFTGSGTSSSGTTSRSARSSGGKGVGGPAATSLSSSSSTSSASAGPGEAAAAATKSTGGAGAAWSSTTPAHHSGTNTTEPAIGIGKQEPPPAPLTWAQRMLINKTAGASTTTKTTSIASSSSASHARPTHTGKSGPPACALAPGAASASHPVSTPPAMSGSSSSIPKASTASRPPPAPIIESISAVGVGTLPTTPSAAPAASSAVPTDGTRCVQQGVPSAVIDAGAARTAVSLSPVLSASGPKPLAPVGTPGARVGHGSSRGVASVSGQSPAPPGTMSSIKGCTSSGNGCVAEKRGPAALGFSPLPSTATVTTSSKPGVRPASHYGAPDAAKQQRFLPPQHPRKRRKVCMRLPTIPTRAELDTVLWKALENARLNSLRTTGAGPALGLAAGTSNVAGGGSGNLAAPTVHNRVGGKSSGSGAGHGRGIRFSTKTEVRFHDDDWPPDKFVLQTGIGSKEFDGQSQHRALHNSEPKRVLDQRALFQLAISMSVKRS
ncbi:unnamed protein product [Amoebophrya sp. A120]|nr:unnamed protein product [Amoebophrya sp. A120]|eukprot:GSA120T00020349001.1